MSKCLHVYVSVSMCPLHITNLLTAVHTVYTATATSYPFVMRTMCTQAYKVYTSLTISEDWEVSGMEGIGPLLTPCYCIHEVHLSPKSLVLK